MKHLSLGCNFIKDISVIKDLNNIKSLNIRNLELELDQIQHLNSCKNLEELQCYKGFKNMTSVKYLNKGIKILP